MGQNNTQGNFNKPKLLGERGVWGVKMPKYRFEEGGRQREISQAVFLMRSIRIERPHKYL